METNRKEASENWEEEASTMINQGYKIVTDENNKLWWVLEE